MNPKQFLLIGGIVLLALGIVGFLGVFNDTKSAFYLDQGENVAHTSLGIIAIAASFLISDAMLQKWLVAVVGVTESPRCSSRSTASWWREPHHRTPSASRTWRAPRTTYFISSSEIWALGAAFLPRGQMVTAST